MAVAAQFASSEIELERAERSNLTRTKSAHGVWSQCLRSLPLILFCPMSPRTRSLHCKVIPAFVLLKRTEV